MAIPRMSKDELKLRLDGPAAEAPLLLDARLKYPYEHSTMTLPGAIRFAAGPSAVDSLPSDRDIVVYDSDPDDMVSERLAAQLIAGGRRAFVLEGGIAGWAGAKLPTDSKTAPQPAVAPGAQKG